MNDFLRSGLVYVPAWVLGRCICREFTDYVDPFIVAWILGCTAVLFRLQGPQWIRPR